MQSGKALYRLDSLKPNVCSVWNYGKTNSVVALVDIIGVMVKMITVRGQTVLFDRDVVVLYHVQTREIYQSV